MTKRRTPTPSPFARRPDEGWRSRAFSGAPEREFGYYGSAYLRAARVLFRSLHRRRGGLNVDHLPVIFLYRHAIELLSKAIIIQGNELLQLSGEGRDVSEIFKDFKASKHQLPPLLKGIKAAFKAAGWKWFWPRSPIRTFQDTNRILQELDKLDRDSFAYRYPTNLKGKAPPGSHQIVGLKTMPRTLDALADALETAVFGLEGECSISARSGSLTGHRS